MMERLLDDTQYEPPRIEAILTGAELEREVLYAGGVATVGVMLRRAGTGRSEPGPPIRA